MSAEKKFGLTLIILAFAGGAGELYFWNVDHPFVNLLWRTFWGIPLLAVDLVITAPLAVIAYVGARMFRGG